ncbi:hypothetical protein WJX81_007632 [Elliptochloris bilobata]|uniref:PIG-P domain-containing protein n=1 Tax=Elliptochloris bilobata TaxID=381761 RepID=A0AAW1QXC5_9CHLO
MPVAARGFLGWVASALAFAAFLTWAYLPDDNLRALGVTRYPSREWAVRIPAADESTLDTTNLLSRSTGPGHSNRRFS